MGRHYFMLIEMLMGLVEKMRSGQRDATSARWVRTGAKLKELIPKVEALLAFIHDAEIEKCAFTVFYEPGHSELIMLREDNCLNISLTIERRQ